jgi:methylated-DNA-protein-cysteine methyltransferase-like protein
MTDSTRRIVKALRAVPRGKVSCYRDIALAAGLPNGARQVARVLHSMSEKHHLPWHRIIRADGFIALKDGEGRELQTQLLNNEGVEVSKFGWVDLAVYAPSGRAGEKGVAPVAPTTPCTG